MAPRPLHAARGVFERMDESRKERLHSTRGSDRGRGTRVISQARTFAVVAADLAVSVEGGDEPLTKHDHERGHDKLSSQVGTMAKWRLAPSLPSVTCSSARTSREEKGSLILQGHDHDSSMGSNTSRTLGTR